MLLLVGVGGMSTARSPGSARTCGELPSLNILHVLHTLEMGVSHPRIRGGRSLSAAG